MVFPVRTVERWLNGEAQSNHRGLPDMIGKHLDTSSIATKQPQKVFGAAKSGILDVKNKALNLKNKALTAKSGVISKVTGLTEKMGSISMAPIAGVVGSVMNGVTRMSILDNINDRSGAAEMAAGVDEDAPITQVTNAPNIDPVEDSVPAIAEDNNPVEEVEEPPYDLLVGSNLSTTVLKDSVWDLMEILGRWRFLNSFIITNGAEIGTIATYDQANIKALMPSYIPIILFQFNYIDFCVEFEIRVFSTAFDSGLLKVAYADLDTNYDHPVYKPDSLIYEQGTYLPLGQNYSRIIRIPFSGLVPDAVMFNKDISDYCTRNYHNRLVLSHFVKPVISSGSSIQIFSRFVKLAPKAPLCQEWVETSSFVPSPDSVPLPIMEEEDPTMILFKPYVSVYSITSTTDEIVALSCTSYHSGPDPALNSTPPPSDIMRCFCKYIAGGKNFNLTLIAPEFRSCMLRLVFCDVGDTLVKYTTLGDCAVFDMSEDFNLNVSAYPRLTDRHREIDAQFGTLGFFCEHPYADNSESAANLIVFRSITTDTEYFQRGNYFNIAFNIPTGGFNYVDFSYRDVIVSEHQETSQLIPVGTGPVITSTDNSGASSAEITTVAPIEPRSLLYQNNFLQHSVIAPQSGKVARGASFELFYASPMNLFSMSDERNNFARSFIMTNGKAIVRPTPISAFGLYYGKWNGDFIASVGVTASTNMSGTFGLVFVPHSTKPTFKGFRAFPLKEIDVSTDRSGTISCPYDCSTPFKLNPPTIGQWDTVMKDDLPVPRCTYWGADHEVAGEKNFDLLCSGILYLVALTDIFVPSDTDIGISLSVMAAPNFRLFSPRTSVNYACTETEPAFEL